MAWAILAAIPLCFLLLLFLIRFRYHAEFESPASLRVTAGVHFLWWRKNIAIEPGRAVWGGNNGADDENGEEVSVADAPGGSGFSGPAQSRPGERGAVRLPEFLTTRLGKARARARKAGTKWILDPGVWRQLILFLWRSGRRTLWLIRPRMESLHIALADAYALGRVAGAWSVLAGTFPELACGVTYGFGAAEAAVKVRAGGRFTALGILTLLLLSITTFPWAGLASRFADCWRDPRLTRWQRRVLLP